MSLVNVYLTAEQRGSVLRALNTMQRWAQGDVGVFAELAEKGILRDADGQPLSLSLWSTVVEPALSELASLVAGTTPGMILDVHDPSTDPVAAVAFALHTQLSGLKVSKKHRSLAAFGQSMDLHKTGVDAFDLYERAPNTSKSGSVLRASGLTSKEVLATCTLPGPLFKLSFDQKDVHKVLGILDIYSRVLMGQWEYLKELTNLRWSDRRSDWHDLVEKAVKEFKAPWTKYSMNASSGISNPKIHPDATIVWNVLKAVRHWDMVHRCGYSHRGVATDAPMRDERWAMVDAQASAGLDSLPIGAGVVGTGQGFQCLEQYGGTPGKVDVRLASSYSLVSLLDAVAYAEKNPAQAPTF